MIRYSLFIALFLILQACGGEEKVELKTEKEKYSYVLGCEIAKPFINPRLPRSSVARLPWKIVGKTGSVDMANFPRVADAKFLNY